MRISEQLIEEIKTNNNLSLDLAKKAGISQSGILKQAERRSKLLMGMYRTAILNYDRFKISYKDSIKEILASYGITEEEFSYESIRKDFNRKADEIRKNLY